MSAIDWTVAGDAAYEEESSEESALGFVTVLVRESFNFRVFSSKSIAFDNPFYHTQNSTIKITAQHREYAGTAAVFLRVIHHGRSIQPQMVQVTLDARTG